MLREGSYRKPACRPRSFPRPLSAPQSPDPTTLFPILPGPERGTALPLPVAPRCAPPPSVWLMGLATPGSFVSRPGIRSSLFPHFASFSSPGTPFPGVHCGARPLAFARCPLPTLPNFHSPPHPTSPAAVGSAACAVAVAVPWKRATPLPHPVPGPRPAGESKVVAAPSPLSLGAAHGVSAR